MVGGANTEEGQRHKQGQTMLNEELQEGMRTGPDQSTDCGNDIHPALLVFTPQPQDPPRAPCLPYSSCPHARQRRASDDNGGPAGDG